MRITDYLREDHSTFRRIMEALEEVSREPEHPHSHRRLIRLMYLLHGHWTRHVWAEKNFFYPSVQKAIEPSAKSLVDLPYIRQLEREHLVITEQLKQLVDVGDNMGSSEFWWTTLSVLRTAIASHIEKEESNLFPFAEKVMKESTLTHLLISIRRNLKRADLRL